MTEHNRAVIAARCAIDARLLPGRGATWFDVGGRDQRLRGQRIVNNREIHPSVPNRITPSASSPAPPYSTEVTAVPAEMPSSEGDVTRTVGHIGRIRQTPRVRFSDIEGRWIYDPDEQTSLRCPDSGSRDRECRRSQFQWKQRPNYVFACTLLSLLSFFTLVLLLQLFTHALPIFTRRQGSPNGTHV